jgi:uncharacterized protein (DUF433 family)
MSDIQTDPLPGKARHRINGAAIFAAYPQLRPEHLKAALQYAAQIASDEEILARACG